MIFQCNVMPYFTKKEEAGASVRCPLLFFFSYSRNILEHCPRKNLQSTLNIFKFVHIFSAFRMKILKFLCLIFVTNTVRL